MTDEDGFRIEAAEQFGFIVTNDDADEFKCTEAQLIAFAKACERKGLADSATIAGNELRNVSLLMSNPPKSSAAWDIRNAINKRIEAIDAENAPILATEEERFMTSRGYVRGPGQRWVRPEESKIPTQVSDGECEPCADCPFPEVEDLL